MGLIIQKACKFKQHARVCLWGVEKAGKTHAALELATALAPSGKIGVLSSERGSSASFDRLFPHDIVNLSVDEGYKPVRNPFSAKRYEEGLDLFAYGGYDVIIVDSLSHIWEGEGGILEVVAKGGNEFQDGWKAGSPLYQKFLNHLLNVPCHLIVTLRSKDAYEMEDYTKSDGKPGKRPKNVGSAPVIRKYFGYEMQFMIRVDEMRGEIMSSAYQEELPKGMEIESMSQDFAPALARFLDGAPMPERIPTLQDSYKRGLVTGAWVKETFYATASQALGVQVGRSTALPDEQLKQLAALAEAGTPAESVIDQEMARVAVRVVEADDESQVEPAKVAPASTEKPTSEPVAEQEPASQPEPKATKDNKPLSFVPTLDQLADWAHKYYPNQWPALRTAMVKMGFPQNAQKWTEDQRMQAYRAIKAAKEAAKAS